MPINKIIEQIWDDQLRGQYMALNTMTKIMTKMKKPQHTFPRWSI